MSLVTSCNLLDWIWPSDDLSWSMQSQGKIRTRSRKVQWKDIKIRSRQREMKVKVSSRQDKTNSKQGLGNTRTTSTINTTWWVLTVDTMEINLPYFCQTPVQSDSPLQVRRTRSWLCFPPVTTTTNNPHQNLPENVLQTWKLATRLNSQNYDQVRCHGWSTTIPRMVTHQPKDGHPPS